ncbi:MAG: hypothetical protein OXE79_04815 [Acidimicrobiaceae bacterium]|nr:hypothetical protein [Acidimicrobiaceae bacterium]
MILCDSLLVIQIASQALNIFSNINHDIPWIEILSTGKAIEALKHCEPEMAATAARSESVV